MSLKSSLSLAVLSAALLVPGLSGAATGQWDSPALGQAGTGASAASPWIGSAAADSLYAEWNFFNGTADASPDIAGSGTLAETTGAAFVTGGGNIYSFSAATAFSATLAAEATGTWDVYLRVAGLGTAVADVATLNGVSATRSVTYTEALGGFGGDEEESLWHWSLPPGADSFTFLFNATGSSLSLDQVALYAVRTAAPVPEPESWALMAAGLGAMGLVMLRRARRAA